MRNVVRLAITAVAVTALAIYGPAQVPAAARATPVGVVPHGPPGSWTLAWADEFSGTSVDQHKWQPNWLGVTNTISTPPVNTAELSCYDPHQVTVSAGAVHLAAVRRSCLGWQYASGLLNTAKTFNFTYGYAEARMFLPHTAAGACTNWPAFWLNGHDGNPIEEVDVMECLQGDVEWVYHYAGYTKRVIHLPPAWHQRMPRTASGWHTFGVDWEPGHLTFYFDGVPQGSAAQSATHPHYLIANLAVSTVISPPVRVPQAVGIDYVRVFKKK
ncbi:MAG: glycoside hydrolase family 16 protein [Oryzihumus sp.]